MNEYKYEVSKYKIRNTKDLKVRALGSRIRESFKILAIFTDSTTFSQVFRVFLAAAEQLSVSSNFHEVVKNLRETFIQCSTPRERTVLQSEPKITFN